MAKVSRQEGETSFDVELLEAARPSCVVAFAAGGGGNPERHLALLTSLQEDGCTVVAPYFERLASPRPTADELLERGRRLKAALDLAAQPGLPLVGVGHSIGATLLLALAGGQVWLGPGQRLPIPPDRRLGRLLLMTPATGFFQAPGALDAVDLPIVVWAGTEDVITPPSQAAFLKQCLGSRVEVRLKEGAGHFSFMNTLPPQIIDPLPNREAFLSDLASEIRQGIAP